MEISKEERNWALAAHLGGPVGNLASAGFLGFLVPLVIWLVKRDESSFVGDQAREAVNFQLTFFILRIVLVVLAIVTLGIGLLITIPGFVVIWLLEVVLGVIAGVRSYDGVYYRYPMSLRLLD